MRTFNVPRVLLLSILGLLSVSRALAAPPTLVWNIGLLDGSEAEFEHENQGDDLFYLNAGDYSSVLGWDTIANLYSLPGSSSATAEPLINTSDATIGFERALVAGGTEDTINVYFQLTAAQVPTGAKYRFDAVFRAGVGTHPVTFGLNGHEFAGTNPVGSTLKGYQQTFTAAQVSAQAGGNVLTLRTEGASGYVTLDYLRLTLIDPATIFSFGADDGTQADFEQEGAPRNDAKFYVHAGDYTGVTGTSGTGSNVTLPELVRDDTAGGTEGLPRALTSSNTRLDLFFQLTPEQIAAGGLRFDADLFSLGGGSSHDLRFSINGVTLGTMLNVTAAQLASFTFGVNEVGAVAGSNVISIERIGGSDTLPYIQFDYLELTSVPEPSSAALVALGTLSLGCFRRKRETRGTRSR